MPIAKSNPRISVVMSVYNCDNYPIRGIESTLNQNFQEFEFIIIDDGSEKKTKKLLEKYSKSDDRIKIITNEKNIKLASSLNRGIKIARGEYIARADVNINYDVMRLEQQYDFLEKHLDIDILGSNFYWATVGKIEIRKIMLPEKHLEISRKLSRGNCICHPSVMFRKEKLVPFGPYKEGFGKPEDYYLWMQVRSKLKFYNLQEPLLTKWHRSNPWNDRLLDYFVNDIRIRLMGFKTSSNVLRDLFYFPRCIKCLFQF